MSRFQLTICQVDFESLKYIFQLSNSQFYGWLATAQEVHALPPFWVFLLFYMIWPANSVQSIFHWSKYTTAIQTLEFFINQFLLVNFCSLLLSHLFFTAKIIPQNFNFLATSLYYDRACHLLRRSLFVF